MWSYHNFGTRLVPRGGVGNGGQIIPQILGSNGGQMTHNLWVVCLSFLLVLNNGRVVILGVYKMYG